MILIVLSKVDGNDSVEPPREWIGLGESRGDILGDIVRGVDDGDEKVLRSLGVKCSDEEELSTLSDFLQIMWVFKFTWKQSKTINISL